MLGLKLNHVSKRGYWWLDFCWRLGGAVATVAYQKWMQDDCSYRVKGVGFTTQPIQPKCRCVLLSAHCCAQNFCVLTYASGKSLLHQRMRQPFGERSYSICLRGLNAGWLTGFMFFLCIVCTIFINVYFGKSVMTLVDIGEIVCMGIPKCHWMVI